MKIYSFYVLKINIPPTENNYPLPHILTFELLRVVNPTLTQDFMVTLSIFDLNSQSRVGVSWFRIHYRFTFIQCCMSWTWFHKNVILFGGSYHSDASLEHCTVALAYVFDIFDYLFLKTLRSRITKQKVHNLTNAAARYVLFNLKGKP